MFETETKLCQFFLQYVKQLSDDVTDENLVSRPDGKGHTPLWILGHLAICGEMGLKMLGESIEHRQWLPLFAPGTPDNFDSADGHSRNELLAAIESSYPKMCELAHSADQATLDQPHGVDLLAGTPVATVGDLVAHLATTHLAFHCAQLSSWRQASGHRHLF